MGFWYGLNNSWIEWAEGEMGCGSYLFELDIDLDNVFIIEKLSDLDKLYENYSLDPSYKYYMWRMSIDWRKVMSDFSGIELRNFDRYKYKAKYFWTSFWDCSSGCIWKNEVIKNINFVGKLNELSN